MGVAAQTKPDRLPAGLWALAVGGFGIGLTELCVMGLLPEIAGEFDVSAAHAGALVSVYALAVAVGALVLPVVLRRFERRAVLLGLVVLFIVGNLISAVAPAFGVLLVGRVVAALCHGAFFSVGSVVAADLVSAQRRASAVAVMFGGLTVSTVVGTPLGTFLGQVAGWRSVFWVLVGVGVLTLAAIRVLVSRIPAPEVASLRGELAVLGDGRVWASALVSVLAFAALIGPYTYVAFILTEGAGFASDAVPWLLLVFGVGTFVGNWIGGRAADRSIDRALAVFLACLAVVLGMIAWLIAVPAAVVIGLVLWAVGGYATAPGLQIRLIDRAPQAPTLGAGVNIASLNVGNALGAWLGGASLAAGTGTASPLWVGALLAVLGVGAVAVARLIDHSVAARRVTPTGRRQAGR